MKDRSLTRAQTKFAALSLGGLYIAVLTFGGSASPSLPTDALLMVATVVICCGALLARRRSQVDARLFWLTIAVMGVVALQALPLPWFIARIAWPAPVREAFDASGAGPFTVMSLSLDRALAALALAGSASLLAWTLTQLGRDGLQMVAKLIGIGVAASVFAGLIQLSLAGLEWMQLPLLPYRVRIGFFANPNHYATLMLMTIPPLVLWRRRGARLGALGGLAVVLALTLGAGSAAGVLIGLSILALSFLLLDEARHDRAIALPVTVVGGGLFLFGAFQHLAAENWSSPHIGRLDFLRTAIEAILASPIFGTGFGNFPSAYQIYERTQDISTEYVNRAHNDYAELLMEAGVLGLALLVAYVVLTTRLVIAGWSRPAVRAAALSILVVLAHSLVDYPLRTMAILYLFIFAHAVLLSPEAVSEEGDADDAEKSRRSRGRSRRRSGSGASRRPSEGSGRPAAPPSPLPDPAHARAWPGAAPRPRDIDAS